MNTIPGLLTALSSAPWLHLNSTHTDGCSLFRREFSLEQVPVAAMAVFAAAGYGEVWVNGQKADATAVLEPAWSQWDQRLLAPSYNVTAKLNKGLNAIGLILGAGWYGHLNNMPAIKLALGIQMGEQENMTLVTDGNWTVGSCPILNNDIYRGESYDARLEQESWSKPGHVFPWPNVVPSGPPVVVSQAALSLQSMNPIRASDLLKPTFVAKNGNATLLDFRQNIAGWVQLSLKSCSRDTSVRVRHAEFLVEDRSALYVANLRLATATDTYICKGGAVLHEPRFTYHGFRYVEILVEGNASWSWADQRARIVHSEVNQRGWLRMANDVLTRVQSAIRWTQLDNLHSVPTDCPQRDERQGWMADGSVSAEQAIHNFDMKAFYTTWLQTIADAQNSTVNNDCKITVPGGGINGTCLGAVTDTSPHVPGVYGTRPADPSWGAALPILVDLLSRYFGADTVGPFIAPVHAWADFLLSMRQNGTVKYSNYGDWLEPGKVASDPIVKEMASGFNGLWAMHVASMFGDNVTRSRFSSEFEAMRAAFHQNYWNDALSTFGDGSQAPQIFALYWGGLSSSQENASLNCLLDSLENHGIRTGIIATKWLFPVLSKYGHTALGLRLASSSAFPSWGYMIAKDATTIWEHWDTYHNPSGDSMSSHNHPAFTSVGAWFYTDLVGIRSDRFPVELGPTLDVYDDLLPRAAGRLMLASGEVEVLWQMRPYVAISGVCPVSCVVRVPLDGMSFAAAKADLQSGGAHQVDQCGRAACVQVSAGKFDFRLASVSNVLV